jgi:hypothetical protein
MKYQAVGHHIDEVMRKYFTKVRRPYFAKEKND